MIHKKVIFVKKYKEHKNQVKGGGAPHVVIGKLNLLVSILFFFFLKFEQNFRKQNYFAHKNL